MILKIKRMYVDSPDLQLPDTGNIGYDLVAHSISDRTERYIEYDTGLAFEIQASEKERHHLEVLPRSSISNYDLVLCNSIGLIDIGYRATIKLRFKILQAVNPVKMYEIGDKIGQLVVRNSFLFDNVEYVEQLSETKRNLAGFGSTGK